MPTITLPDGKQLQFDGPVTVAEVAARIGAGLARAALAGEVDERLVDTSHTATPPYPSSRPATPRAWRSSATARRTCWRRRSSSCSRRRR